MLRDNPNLATFLQIVEKLESLLDRIAFVGGCVTGLLVSDPAATPTRPTLDVDAIVQVASYDDFRALETNLSRLGFRNDPSVICRWSIDNLKLDLMPTDSSILGFTNVWYGPALQHSQRMQLGKHHARIITAPYFVATKLEAFHGRGQNDFSMSHDLEDIITVIDGRPELPNEVAASDSALRSYLAEEMRSLLRNRDFLDALPGHLLPDSASQQRATIVLDRIRQIIESA